MLLDRLRIRGKLVLLVIVPFLATLSMQIVNAFELRAKVDRASATGDAVHVARLTGALVRDLQYERLLIAGYLGKDVSRGRLLLQQVAVTEAAAELQRELGAAMPAPLATAVQSLDTLVPLRTIVLDGTAELTDTLGTYGTLVTGLIDGMRLLEAVDGDTPQGRQVVALDAIMRANEGFSTLLAAMAVAKDPADLAPFVPGVAQVGPMVTRFFTYASADQRAFYESAVAATDARFGGNFTADLLRQPDQLTRLPVVPPFSALESLTNVGLFVETKTINDVAAAAAESERLEIVQLVAFVAISDVAIVLALILGTVIARSITRRLRRLTRSADRVSGLAESELTRVADDESPTAEPARLQPIDVVGKDEVGDLARAFGRVQQTAARLVERQVASRRNVAVMFGHVGRRTQNLVGRQVALIDKLERDETDANRLRDLYRLDHVSSRLRRSASSLVVLSGVAGTDEHVAPIEMGELLRLAVGEIEDYTRVDIETGATIRVAPSLISDLILLTAELMENATTFSPPGTRVKVSATAIPEGARLTVVDHGIGMSEERYAAENARLTRRERLDLVPTEVLGLFVVGRLARRHELGIELTETPGGGVTATVTIPARLLASPHSVAGPRGHAAGLRTQPLDSRLAELQPIGRGGRMSATTGASSTPFNVEALERANDTVLSVQPWNAFRTPLPQPTPGDVPQDIPVLAPGRAELGPASSAPPPAGGSSLNRRVPGATLSALGGNTQPGMVRVPVATQADPAQADAAAVRDSLADFESGVARAMRELDNGANDHDAWQETSR